MVAPSGERLALSGGQAVRVGPLDAAHDQPGGDVLGLAAGGERGERNFGDLGVAQDPPLLVVVPDCLRVADRRPGRPGDAGDRGVDRRGHAGGDREPSAAAAAGGGDVGAAAEPDDVDRCVA
jgi:hypothetical protein